MKEYVFINSFKEVYMSTYPYSSLLLSVQFITFIRPVHYFYPYRLLLISVQSISFTHIVHVFLQSNCYKYSQEILTENLLKYMSPVYSWQAYSTHKKVYFHGTIWSTYRLCFKIHSIIYLAKIITAQIYQFHFQIISSWKRSAKDQWILSPVE